MSLHQTLLFFHILTLAMAMGIGFANLVNMRLAKTQTGDIAKGLVMHRVALRNYHDVMVLALLASGILLLINLGGTTGLSKWFHIKMAAVAIFAICHFAARYFSINGITNSNPAQLARAKILSHIALTFAVIAVLTAVLAFAA